jgi:V8-like Glu-specific endopeptidase
MGGFLVMSCGSADGYEEESLGASREKSICGVDDMQDVEQYDGSLGPSIAFVASHQAPVGMIRWKNDLATRYTNPGDVNGSAWCTATLLSADILITAGHCFDVDGNTWVWPRDNGTGMPISSAQGATEMRVEFNYQLDPNGVPRTITPVNVVELVEYRLGQLDYAVIRVAGTPASTFGKSVVTPFPMVVGAPITIIQHPAGQPKQIHAGPLASISPTYWYYSTADTLGGSSGSGVLNPSTGLIHAVHTNGGCTAQGGTNAGLSVQAIYAHSPSVRRLSFDAAKLATALL